MRRDRNGCRNSELKLSCKLDGRVVLMFIAEYVRLLAFRRVLRHRRSGFLHHGMILVIVAKHLPMLRAVDVLYLCRV